MSVDSNISSGTNLSYWINSARPKSYSKLNQNIETDVLIVGAGISGEVLDTISHYRISKLY